MQFRRRSYRSSLSTQKRVDLVDRIAALFAQRPSRLVIKKGDFRASGDQLVDVSLDTSRTGNEIQFQRRPFPGTPGEEITDITAVADTGALEASSVTAIADTGAKATGSLATTTPIALTSALMGTTRNTTTFHTVIAAAAANSLATVGAAFTGTASAIILTITPNDGTHNSATPVTLTTAQVAELINTGAVAGKTITLTDGSSLRTKQTATGGGAVDVVASGEGDNLTATFAAGANSNLNSKYFNFSDALDAHKYYAWLNVNGEGVDPTVATRTGVPIAVAAGASANTIATALRAAIGALGSSAYFTTGGATAVCTITNQKMGNSTNTADGTAATGFTISTTTPGHASNLNSTFFKQYKAANAITYYVWFNVNSEGVDPTPGGTAIPVTLAAGATAAAVATAAAAAIDAVTTAFDCAAPSGATFEVVNHAAGYATDTADGTAATGFTFRKRSEREQYSLADIYLIKRLRTKKWLIELKDDADSAHAS